MTAVVVTAVVHPAPGQKEALVEALRTTMPGVHEEQGCRLYAIHDADDGTVTMIEKWDSAADLQAHSTSPAVEALRDAVAPYVTEPATVTTMTAIPVGGAAGTL